MTGPLGLDAKASSARRAAGRRLRALYTREWVWREAQKVVDEDDPTEEIRPYLPELGPAAQARRLARWTGVMRRLQAIDPADLSPDEQLNQAVYMAQIRALLAAQAFRDFEKPLNADTFFWGDTAFVARRPFHGEADYRNFIAQMRQIPRYFSQAIDNMRAGLARGFTPPRVTLRGRDETIAVVAQAASPEETVFYQPFAAMPATMAAALQDQLRKEAREVIAEAVIPAHRALLVFMREIYLPGARETIAAADLPDGAAYYRSKILEFTTLDLSADQIHRIGLEAVSSIREQMGQVMTEVGFDGDLAAFLAHLRTDERFYATSAEQLLKEAAHIAKQFDAIADQWFGRLPRARFAIRPVPDDLAPYYTAGRGGPGLFLLNTYDLASRPLFALRALTLHESAPGHAFQMPLAAENTRLPEFRRKVYLSAYGEGWALYCERLGLEMGLYETPYDRFGMLAYQVWRAARLVVDTGLHAHGWSRDRAQAYLRDNTALSEHEIETEVDRYIAWPAQALSYYLGQKALIEARARAEAALGPRFDIRAFHDTVLEMGCAPLPALDRRIDRFIAEGGRGPYAGV